MLTRRKFIAGLAGFPAIGLGTATYGMVIEAGYLLNITAYAFTPPRWTPGLKLCAVVIADPHIVTPYFPLSRWQSVIETTQTLEPDVVFMLGDYTSGIKFGATPVPLADIARVAATLKAPLGVYSINGNHDWWSDGEAQRLKKGPPQTQRAFEDAGIPVLVNRAVRLVKDGYPFWVSGTDSMISYITEPDEFHGTDNLPATLAHVTDDAPIIHLAHEPDMFAKIPERVSITLAGHTHGGQVRVLGRAPFTPSHYGRSHSYGHIIENDRHLIVSGGLGTSTIPIRLGVPPEINLLELG